MQKKLIALAVVAAFSAPAFADVTMYGVVDAAIASASGDGQKSDVIAVSGGLSQSRLGAKAVEDLDNGMKAVAVLEYGLDAQNNSTIGLNQGPVAGTAVFTARQQMLALAGGFGTVASGYLQTTGYDWAVKFDPTAGTAVSPLQNVTTGRFLVGATAIAARAQRALAYISPNFSGFSFAVNYTTALAGLGNLGQPSGATTGLKTTAYLVSGNYDWNALSVGAVYAKTNDSNAGAANISDIALGASYDFKVVKLSGTYQNTKLSTGGAGTDKALSISAVAPVGPGAILASYAKSTIDSTAAADNGASVTVGWLQGLSKTTTLYVTYTKVTQDAGTRSYSVLNDGLSNGNLNLGGGSQLIALGLNKKF